jgi:hypothetical protein
MAGYHRSQTIYCLRNVFRNAARIALSSKQAASTDTKAVGAAGQCQLEDVLETVKAAQNEYQNRVEGSKIRKHLSTLSSRIMHYSRIVDVLAQYHPEYASLAWGTMKLLFVVSFPWWQLRGLNQWADVE